MTLVGNDGVGREKMKKEIIKEVRHDEKRRKAINCLGCLFLKLIFFLVVALLVAFGVAKTGLYEIPVLTNWLYHPGEPIRVVQPLIGSDGEQVMRNAMARAEYNAAVNLFSVNLTEQELTTLVVEAAAKQGGESGFEIKLVQMTVSEEGIELFAVSPRSERDVTIKSLIRPVVTEGKMLLDVRTLEIGALSIPGSFVSLVSKIVSGQLSDALSLSASGLGELHEVRTEDKQLYIVFKPQLKLPF